ncbi:hypothetical protein [Bradyrhizobium sp. SEMIA]|nr:hypothetical protein [Bradyrhizobium sp. SEMIA]QOG23050.1 hypothetical protein FOM02_43165 [Bradyrhizobium sp. SEMIA]
MDYRAYILDDDGRITGVHELDCANDEVTCMLLCGLLALPIRAADRGC